MCSRFEHIRCLENASAVQHLLERLDHRTGLAALHITLLHSWECWVLRVRSRRRLSETACADLRALIKEYSLPPPADPRLGLALLHLDRGLAPVEVMQRLQVPIVVCGQFHPEDLEIFCESFTRGLGYRPASLR
jgi:hypothetical protein